jgi:hypothetical protein
MQKMTRDGLVVPASSQDVRNIVTAFWWKSDDQTGKSSIVGLQSL